MWKFFSGVALCVAITVAVSLPKSSIAAINEQIPFYGTLQDTGGNDLSGTYDMVFRFYDASSGGTLLDTSTHTAANGNAVTVTNGEFSAMLGSGTGNSLDGLNFNTASIYVGVTIGTDSEMTPRERLGSAAYSFNTDLIDGYDSLDLLRLNATNTISFSSATPLLSIIQNGLGDILNIFDGGIEVFSILDGGNVGVGTSSPSSRFTVSGDARITGALRDSSGDAGTNGMVLLSTGSGTNWVATSSLGISGGGGGSLFTDGGATTYLTATGDNLSVGGTGGTARLNVFGDIDIASPAASLLFGGTRMLYASTTSDTISLGEFAGLSFNTGTTYNIAFGYEAARNVSAATADSNIFIGYQAGIRNSGSDNTIAGYQAGEDNIGDLNVMIGQAAGGANEGGDNVLLGTGSGYFNTGSWNNIIGTNAGYTNQGDDNNIFGDAAGSSNTGSYNNLFGTGAGSTNTGGYNNIIGYNAGYSNTGANSVLLGLYAGYNNSGNGITAIGDSAGYSNTGSGGVLVGTSAGFSNSGTNVIAIGLEAGETNTGNESIFIGTRAGENGRGLFNTFIGLNAGRTSPASHTIAIGQSAGQTSGGSENVYVGLAAGNNSTSSRNSFFGYYSGFSNTGANNSFVGAQSGDSNTGDFNNFFGYQTGTSNTGDYNNIIGVSAGVGTSGSYNNYLGYGVSDVNTGNYNNFFGYYAARFLSATNTVAIGTETLYGDGVSGTQSVNNIAIGYRAGYGVRSGSDNNILIGYRVADNLTTGNNNIIIGYDIDNITATADNRLNIGNLIFGTGIDGTGTTLSSGNIGIGTSSPASKFTVSGDARITGALRDSSGDAGTNGMVLLSTGAGTNWVATSSLGISGGGGGSLFTDGGATTYLTATGDNVAIGGTSASDKLSVSGNINIAGDFGYSVNGIRQFYASTTAGTVQIGTFAGSAFSNIDTFNVAIGYGAAASTTPGWVADAVMIGKNAGHSSQEYGSVLVGFDAGYTGLGYQNNIIGYGAGYNNTGNFNNIFGFEAGYNNSDNWNNLIGYRAGYNAVETNAVFIGYQAGYAGVGDSNVSIGYEAGYSSNGYNNNFIGIRAGQGNIGSDNIGIGNYAARYIQGSDNIALGRGAGYGNLGYYNVILGTGAGDGNEGDENVMLGRSSGLSNLGDFNNFIGTEVGYVNWGNYNEFIGYQTGRYIRSTSTVAIGAGAMRGTANFNAVNNTALGYRAGYISSTGANNNILIGYQAADNLTTGNNNIIIGYDIDNITATADNRLNIGNLIFGTGIDGTGTTLASGNVGIGTSTPLQKLQVRGDIRVGTTGSNGCIENYGGGVIGGTCSSDEQLKTNIENLFADNESVLERLVELTPVSYNWNQTAASLYHKDEHERNIGLLAQNVEEQFPELVSRNEDEYRQVNFTALPFYLIGAIKELYEKVTGLEEKTKEIDELRERLERLESNSGIIYHGPQNEIPVSEEPEPEQSGEVLEETAPIDEEVIEEVVVDPTQAEELETVSEAL